MRRLRLQCTILIILACLSIISVGFASWVTANDTTFSFNGSIVVDDIQDNNNYITCNNLKIFKYFKTGFVNENNEIVKNGSISFYLVINNKNCKAKFTDSTDLAISLQLESNNLNLFHSDIISMEVKKDNEPQNPLLSFDQTICVLPIKITNFKQEKDTITLKIEYLFTITNLNEFSNTVYPILLTNDFNFVLSAKLTGSVGE